MPGPERIEVTFNSGARTRCVIESGALERLPELCAEVGLSGTAGFLCDARLVFAQGPLVKALGDRFGGVLARPVSEKHKSLAEVEAMCETLNARGVMRDGFVVALGGGVLTDLAGLAAALHLRGVPWVSGPTTLLAQVDAGLGGKTGANLRAGKNLVGAFHQPTLVVCDPRVLKTLPERERWSGLAEVVKCALLAPQQDALGEALLTRCERDLEAAARGDEAALSGLIFGAVKLKATVVSGDEREGDGPLAPGQLPRAALNLGHTVGHALETATHYERFTHGEAVALGLRSAIELSRLRGHVHDSDAARMQTLVRRLQVLAPNKLTPLEREAALVAMQKDKKARAGQVRFVLLNSSGGVVVERVEAADCGRALDAALD
ncbi:MAG: 3-dehydroquinate synthase [Deltaproteobacteria bacterium]|nr:3-dehydroquinate synthase [Deltaproteobacteria bacterium]